MRFAWRCRHSYGVRPEEGLGRLVRGLELEDGFSLSEYRQVRSFSADQRHPLQYLDSPSGIGVLPWRRQGIFIFF